MSRKPLRLLVLAVTLAALAVTITAPVVLAKGGGNSPNAKACQKGGWADWFESDGTPFTSQDECVAYAAGGGTLVQGGSLTISTGEVGGSFLRLVVNGIPQFWNSTGPCLTGNTALDPNFYEEYRLAMEFPLAAVPANVTITSAALGLRDVAGPSPQHAIYGYAGNGALAVADIEVGGTPVYFTSSESGFAWYDVTSLLTAGVVSSGWAGLSLRQEPFVANSLSFWECTQETGSFTRLTINYTFN